MRVKVCGMRDGINIAAIARLKPDFMGFIFHEPSPRYAGNLDPAALGSLAPSTLRVGVFVDAAEDYIRETAARYRLDFVQLHGTESTAVCSGLRKDIGVIKALGVCDGSDIERAAGYDGSCDYLLFDTKSPVHGGSGRKFDHSLLGAYRGETPYLLSGGLGVEDACLLPVFENGRCAGFDINSRFETAPGVKDPLLVEQFIKTIKK